MHRYISVSVGLAIALGLAAVAQDLPSPPKPPKSKAGTVEAEREKAAAEKGAEVSPSDGVAPRPADEGKARPLRDIRPRRIRINAPFFHMDLDLGGGRYEAPRAEGTPRTEGEAVPAPRADEIPMPRSDDDQSWRYRWHDGRWWYWMPSERWVYWDGGRWMEYDGAARPMRGAGIDLRNLRGLNLQDLMQSGEIRLGQPRRGNVELEFENVPRVNIGF
jgi:hypothetical protein